MNINTSFCSAQIRQLRSIARANYSNCKSVTFTQNPVISAIYAKNCQLPTFSMAQGGPGIAQTQPQRKNSNLFCLSRTTLSNFNRFLSKAVDTQILTYEQIAEEINSGNDILLIDVREKDETINDGKIPTSKNIPLGELAAAIQLDEDAFMDKYGFPKPHATQGIVVHCKKGPRAFNSASILKYGGYPNVRVYSGILDWKENGGALE